MTRRSFVSNAAALTAGWGLASRAQALGGTPSVPYRSFVIAWNQALTSAIAATRTQATIAARACSMVHEAAYNAWAAFDSTAAFTLSAMHKQPAYQWGQSFQAIAISQAAYGVLVDLFPSQKAAFDTLLAAKLASPFYGQSPWLGARQAGQLAADSLLQMRHADGSNQLGDLAPGAYADDTGYRPVNTPDTIVDPNHWQPLRFVNADGVTVVQQYLTPQWGGVRPFALASGSALRPAMTHLAPTAAEMNQLLAFSAALDDTHKSLVDYWAANPGTVSPPGQWMQIAETVAATDNLSLDDAMKLFFTVGQAVLDASIAAWDVKRAYDSVRPITAIPYHYRGQLVTAWAGFNKGIATIRGEDWRPYQRSTNPTPPFPEFVSGHSTFSAASAAVIAGLRGSDVITLVGVMPAGGIGFETNTPKQAVTFTWKSLSEAADAAGLSRRYGGIHFEQGDLSGRALGRAVGAKVLAKCRALFAGRTG